MDRKYLPRVGLEWKECLRNSWSNLSPKRNCWIYHLRTLSPHSERLSNLFREKVDVSYCFVLEKFLWEKEELEPNDLSTGRDGKKYLDEYEMPFDKV